jgi:hypothetical protein
VTGQEDSDAAETVRRRQRALRARMAAHHLHAGIRDAAAHTTPARAAFLARSRRAEHARKAYFLRLALASAHARRTRRTSDGAAPPTDP